MFPELSNSGSPPAEPGVYPGTITGEVVREIPTKELRALYAKMNELVGMILNKQV